MHAAAQSITGRYHLGRISIFGFYEAGTSEGSTPRFPGFLPSARRFLGLADDGRLNAFRNAENIRGFHVFSKENPRTDRGFRDWVVSRIQTNHETTAANPFRSQDRSGWPRISQSSKTTAEKAQRAINSPKCSFERVPPPQAFKVDRLRTKAKPKNTSTYETFMNDATVFSPEICFRCRANCGRGSHYKIIVRFVKRTPKAKGALQRFEHVRWKERHPFGEVRLFDDAVHPSSGLPQSVGDFVVVLDSDVPELFPESLGVAFHAFLEGDPLFLAQVGNDPCLHADGTLFVRILTGVAIRFAEIRFHIRNKCRHSPLRGDYFLFFKKARGRRNKKKTPGRTGGGLRRIQTE